jgi:muconolactone delta-isomerase
VKEGRKMLIREKKKARSERGKKTETDEQINQGEIRRKWRRPGDWEE